MRFSDLRDMTEERAALLDKKRLGKRQKARVVEIDRKLENHVSPTPSRPVTGLDENGQSRGDRWGNVYQMHRHTGGGKGWARRSRRAMRFGGGGGVQPFRSRILRSRRKQRTGGIR